jgi:prephenate dehydrogenase
MTQPPSGPGVAIGSVVVVGTGLIGTSAALALAEQGVRVWLTDRDPAAARLAADLGAGEVLPDGVLPEGALSGAAPDGAARDGAAREGAAREGAAREGAAAAPPAPAPGHPFADLAVLAVPPAVVAATLAAAQASGLATWYTDVASVKSYPVREAAALGCDLRSFVPGHPLAGRERSGPAAARADLFLGRPWVLCPLPENPAPAVAAVTALARSCRAEPVQLSPGDHDRYVALVSHAPHVVAAAMAGRLAGAPDGALALAGQGLRDVTRIAAGDAGLWSQILATNAGPVAGVLAAVAADLSAAAEALSEAAALSGGTGDRSGSLKPLAGLLDDGMAGVARIPGKRGGPQRDEAIVQVVIRDLPGELARLFQVAGGAGVNIEDIGIEHSPGLPVGVAELTVAPGAVATLTQALAAAGWPVRR